MTGPAIKDFTLANMEPKQFQIDNDVFKAPAIMSPVTLAKLAKLHSQLSADPDVATNVEQTLHQLGAMFKLFLPGPSGERFAERLQSETEPLDIQRQVMPALYWLLEQYGMRPTQPSSPSPNGLTDEPTDTLNGGISSTAGASAEASHI